MPLQLYYGGRATESSEPDTCSLSKLDASLWVLGSGLRPVEKGTSKYSEIELLVSKIDDLRAIFFGSDLEYAEIILAHAYYLLLVPESAAHALENVDIDTASLTNLLTSGLRTELDISRNFLLYLSIRKCVLQALLSPSKAQVLTTFLLSQLLALPSSSNVKAWEWTHILLDEYFATFKGHVSFDSLKASLFSNSLILLYAASYLHRQFPSRIGPSFKEDYNAYLSSFLQDSVYNNKNLHFPLSTETNYALESVVFMLVDSETQRNTLVPLETLSVLVDYAVGHTFHLIRVFHAAVQVKIALFDSKKAGEALLTETIAAMRNYKTFRDLHLRRVRKLDYAVDEDRLQSIGLYAHFLCFLTSLYDAQYQKCLVSSENTGFLAEICAALEEDLNAVLAICGIEKKLFPRSLDNSRLGTAEATNSVLAKGFYAVFRSKIVQMRTEERVFRDFLASEALYSQLEDMIRTCLVLDGGRHSQWGLEYAVFVLRFGNYALHSDVVLLVLKRVLSTNIENWRCWSLLLVLMKSNCGLEGETADIKGLIARRVKKGIPEAQKRDVVELKLTDLCVTRAEEGPEECLARLPELFDLASALFRVEEVPKKAPITQGTVKTTREEKKGLFRLNTLKSHTSRSRSIWHRKAKAEPESAHAAGPQHPEPPQIEVLVSLNDSVYGNGDTTYDSLSIAETRAASEGPSKPISKVTKDVSFSDQKTLQKVWLFASKLYLDLDMLSEAKDCLSEAVSAFQETPETISQSAKIVYQSAKTVQQKLWAFNEYERAITMARTSDLPVSKEAVVGLLELVLGECELGTKTEDVLWSDELDSEEEEFAASTDAYSSDPGFAKLEDASKSTIFMNEDDKRLAVLRVQTLLENELLLSYLWFNNVDVWNCVQRVYKEIGDENSYIEALEKTIKLEENHFVRDPSFFEEW